MTEDLLELALRDPVQATVECDAVIASSDDPGRLSMAYQARGYVFRQYGRMEESLRALRCAIRLARSVDQELLADVRGTYATTLALAGRTRQALAVLDQVDASVDPEVGAKTQFRRAWVLTYSGRNEAAIVQMDGAVRSLRRHGSPTWQGRAVTTLGHLQLALGRVNEAEASFVEAVRILRRSGHVEEAEVAFHNLGRVAFVRGDIPSALEIHARAHVQDGSIRPVALAEECDVYLAAGLTKEAVHAIEQFLRGDQVPVGVQADLILTMARVHLAEGEAERALIEAETARRAFERQSREWYAMRARLVQVQARVQLGRRAGLASAARDLADGLDAQGADEAPDALVLAGRLAAASECQRSLWLRAATYRSRPRALVRASAWLGVGLHRDALGDRAGVLRACQRGFAALDEHRRTLGSSELRALATAHGRELAELALRNATADGRMLLRWSERWRATSLAEPPVTPKGDVLPELAALRDSRWRLAQARAAGESMEHLEAERARLERAVRAAHHRRAGQHGAVEARFNIEVLIAQVGGGCLVELVDVDGTLHVVVVHDGKVRRRVAGSSEEALALAAHARSAVRRAAHGRPYQPGDLGERLQEVLLGLAADLLPDGPVVLSPTGRLHAVPWSMLPTLTNRAFSIVPSAAQWQRARAVPKPRRKKVLLLAAPGLGSGGSEVPKLVRRHEGATVLRGKKATVEAALAGLDGASLAHVAAHGHFRQDSPLFSSLEMADGSLSVYELERLRRAPYRLVLSACESGVLAPVGADELLGLASALFSMGTAGLVCSIAEVNDDATAALMVDLHDHLLAHPKEGLAGALLAARRAAQGDPTREATAAAFLALGI